MEKICQLVILLVITSREYIYKYQPSSSFSGLNNIPLKNFEEATCGTGLYLVHNSVSFFLIPHTALGTLFH